MNNADLARYSKRIARMFWDPPPKIDDNSPMWCLGARYEVESPKPVNDESSRLHDQTDGHGIQAGLPSRYQPSEESAEPDDSFIKVPSNTGNEDTRLESFDSGWPTQFLDDFESRIWLTYRSNFKPIPKSQDPKASAAISWTVKLRNPLNQEGFTSDTGWGCMIRSGQSMLANALSIVRLGRGWRRGSHTTEERRLLALFADDPKAPFSIHKFVEHGASACGKHPGEWFGPSATARCIKALSEGYTETGLRVYITGDGADVYENALFKCARGNDGIFYPTLVLVGIRLGIHRITPVYWEALKASLKLPQAVGIAGGRPSASHYFVGTQSDHFFYLDPHITRPLLPLHNDLSLYTEEDIDSCHTRRLRRIHIEEMDPSMLIAFLIHDEQDWKEWREGIEAIQGKSVLNIVNVEPTSLASGQPREEAIDEVESFDDD